jgi:YD repeat-containing protein
VKTKNFDFADPSTSYILTARHAFGETTAFVRDTSGNRGSSPWKIRKTQHWHKKSQFAKRPKIWATVKSVKNAVLDDLPGVPLCFLELSPAQPCARPRNQPTKLTQSHANPEAEIGPGVGLGRGPSPQVTPTVTHSGLRNQLFATA